MDKPQGKTLGRALGSIFKRWLLLAIIWGVGVTTRKTWINWHVLETLRRQGRPYILCAWHNTILYFVYVLGPLHLPAMVSRSRDGDDIAWVLERFGFTGVRGSPAQGGPQALREMLRALAGGRNVVITPDGPRGPRYALKAGVTALARRKGVPIVPVTYSAPRRWEFGSWDRMRLPKPFSSTVIWVGDPIEVTEEDDEAARLRVQAAMRTLARQAEAFTGADRRFPDPALWGEPA